ncbi:serine hydrolase domain-containing protein [Colwellia hornerae]|uniref:Beta-lactamase family protein n=1 Tax=Colwellia hornerae TaxID=89402 RepID=A0A5C6Q2I8_9GAMM|nr:serine hydrolase domain-containing protein [Colwellia hornerae]TWX45738.1 beta-lactamase family protein [Colwellia hornerae]TWX53737.1 beta-lactamase family protein [Colwellia hornerae]TWX62988.1 beta-lactamase family protein [Colwellia hornerae]
MKILLLIFTILNTITLTVDANVSDSFSGLNSQTPGCAVGVVKKGELVYERYFGQANLRYQVPIDKKTVFNLGSITKHFTAALALQLEAKGQLSVNDSLKKYYPQGPNWFEDVKLHHLINHQSGLPDYLNDEKTREQLVKRVSTIPHVLAELVVGKPIARDVTLMHVLDTMMALSAPSFKPGENSSYSNTGYLLLADILEKASGIPFSELAQQLFKPLGMSSTELVSLHTVETPWSATGYSAINSPRYKYRRNSSNLITQGDGGILSTLPDFAKWISHLMAPIDDKLFWSTFLHPMKPVSNIGGFSRFQNTDDSKGHFISQILSSLKTVSKIGGVPYNNGLFISKVKGETVYSHRGLSIDSMGSYFWLSPSHSIGYIQLCNFSFDKQPSVNEILDTYAD